MPDASSQSSTHKYPVKIYIGQVKHHYGFDSAIDKEAVTSSIYLSEYGLTDDTTADKKYHGGLERALHQYPAEHYAFWQTAFSPRSDKQPSFKAPGMGKILVR